ncbi:MAG: ATP-binding protein [Rhodobacteraceae bacterium]|nr:ATP-binding protein [Paracoccaceae bacterium]
MTKTDPTLHMLCGKMAAGKSTLAAELARADGTVRISEDAWLGALFAEELKTGADYLRYAGKLRTAMAPHVAELLRAGVSVVLDYPANTRDQRAWMREVAETAGVPHRLHYLDVPDEVCLARLRARNAEGSHPFQPTEDMFRRFAKHFEPPEPGEGFTIVRHAGG